MNSSCRHHRDGHGPGRPRGVRLARERARDETWARTLDYDEVSYVAHEVTAEISEAAESGRG